MSSTESLDNFNFFFFFFFFSLKKSAGQKDVKMNYPRRLKDVISRSILHEFEKTIRVPKPSITPMACCACAATDVSGFESYLPREFARNLLRKWGHERDRKTNASRRRKKDPNRKEAVQRPNTEQEDKAGSLVLRRLPERSHF